MLTLIEIIDDFLKTVDLLAITVLILTIVAICGDAYMSGYPRNSSFLEQFKFHLLIALKMLFVTPIWGVARVLVLLAKYLNGPVDRRG